LSPAIAAQDTASSDLSSPILAKDDASFDWNSLHSKFPWDVTATNWNGFREYFPAEIRSNFQLNYPNKGSKASPTITFRPSRNAVPPPVPLEIKGYPIIVPAPTLPSLDPGTSPPPDPRADNPIDPSLALDDDTVKEVLRTYNFALGFYIFLDGSIQIVIPSNCNVESKFNLPISVFQIAGSEWMTDVAFNSWTIPKTNQIRRPESQLRSGEFNANL
jgi:hypothetical protein